MADTRPPLPRPRTTSTRRLCSMSTSACFAKKRTITDRVALGTRQHRSSRDACRTAASCSITDTGTALHGERRIEHGVIRRRDHGDRRTHHQASCCDKQMTMAVLYLLQLYTRVWRALGLSSRFGISGLWDSNVITMSCYRDCYLALPFSFVAGLTSSTI